MTDDGAFVKRSQHIVSNAGLYQLVEDLAQAHTQLASRINQLAAQVTEIHAMCTKILKGLLDV